MLIQLLISMFGIALVYRNLSLLVKIEVISRSKLYFAFYFLQVPFYFYLFFKELMAVIIIYIGIILITLILFDKIIDYFREKTFEKMHLLIIERLILLLKSGKSAQTSSKILFDNLTSWQKATFNRINEVFYLNRPNFSERSTKHEFQQRYFHELDTILRSTDHVTEQLCAFRRALRTYNSLRHKSGQAVLPARGQAWVSFIIYGAIIFLSTSYLNFEIFSGSMLVSGTLFLVGQLVIFKVGGKIQWET